MLTQLLIMLAVIVCSLAVAAGRAHASTVNQARAEVHRLWGPYASRMLCIIAHESSWRPGAVSATGDHGLVQLNAYSWRRFFGARWQHVYDPVENVRMGYVVWRRSGFGAWTTARWC